MSSSANMLQLLQSTSPLTTHGAAAAAGVLRRLAVTDVTGFVGTQIRGFAADVASVSDRQAVAASSTDAATAAAGSAAGAAGASSSQPAAGDGAAAAATATSQQKRRQQWKQNPDSKEGSLKRAGLWLPIEVFKSLSQQEQQRITQMQQQYRKQLQLHKPLRSLHMSAVALNPHQLQVFVALATDAAADDDSSSSSSSMQEADATAASAADSGTDAAQPQAGVSSSSSSRVSRWQRQQQQQPLPEIADSRSRSRINPLGCQFVSQPQLDKRSCTKEPSEQSLVINLNSQMRIAYAKEDYAQVVSLFDQLLAKGIAAVEAAAPAASEEQQQQDVQPQQHKDRQQQQQQQQLVLPLQYRPDHGTLTMYCRALTELADAEERERRSAASTDRYQPQPQQQCTVQRAEQAVALWGSTRVSGMGFPAYLALISAYRLAGRNDKAVEAFLALRAANTAESLNKHYRLWVGACSAAVRDRNYEAANEIARMFSTRQVVFTKLDYRARLVHIFRSLVRGAAAKGKWEDSIYWLQELINNQSMVPVPPEAFLSVMMPAAAAGRMDVVRTMMGAVDQHLELQGDKPLVYHADDLIILIKAAGAASDTALIADAWARLQQDVQQKPTTAASSSGYHSTAQSNSHVDQKPGQPSPAAFKAVVKAYVDSKDFGKALQLVAELEKVYGNTRATSVYGGLSFLPIDELKKEEDIAAVFTQLKARKDAGQPVSTAMMNIVCRAIGRLGNTEVTGKVFESYGAWGLQPDADSYNTVMESCEQAKKVAAVEGLISYMSSKGVEPNQHSWNLLLSTAAAAQDASAVASAVDRMLGSGVQLLKGNAGKALKVAHEARNESLLQLLRKANEVQGLGIQPRAFDGWWRRSRGSSGSGGNGHRSARADSWQQGMPLQQQRQQQQGRGAQIGKMLDQEGQQPGGSESEERKSLRADLAAALGAEMNQ